jgi:hypothetical protein
MSSICKVYTYIYLVYIRYTYIVYIPMTVYIYLVYIPMTSIYQYIPMTSIYLDEYIPRRVHGRVYTHDEYISVYWHINIF